MKWKRVLGWTLFGCGVFVALVAFSVLFTALVNFVRENQSILWWVVGGGSAIFAGWKLAHSDRIPGMYSLPKESTQDVVDYHATILRCLAERIEVRESLGKSITGIHPGESTHSRGCLGCRAFETCHAIKKPLMKRLDRSLRDIEIGMKNG